jgi:hypothetical protein
MSRDAEQAKDRIRAAAWQLAAETSKSDAAKFLESLAREIDRQAWEGPGSR